VNNGRYGIRVKERFTIGIRGAESAQEQRPLQSVHMRYLAVLTAGGAPLPTTRVNRTCESARHGHGIRDAALYSRCSREKVVIGSCE